MCSFCDNLEWRRYKVLQRSSDACDNLCEVMTARLENINGEVFSLGSDCTNCDGCIDYGFELFTYENYMGFSYRQNINELHIGRNSEMLGINFCPWCGKQINNDALLEFDKLYMVSKK